MVHTDKDKQGDGCCQNPHSGSTSIMNSKVQEYCQFAGTGHMVGNASIPVLLARLLTSWTILTGRVAQPLKPSLGFGFCYSGLPKKSWHNLAMTYSYNWKSGHPVVLMHHIPRLMEWWTKLHQLVHAPDVSPRGIWCITSSLGVDGTSDIIQP